MSDTYEWDPYHRFVIDAAIAIKRPLLIRGEPGIGKSSLAEAAAKVLTRNFICEVVSARTEPNDLLWQFDAVGRLADAQCQCTPQERQDNPLSKEKYISPGVLWWAFEHATAQQRHKCCKGTVYPCEGYGPKAPKKDWVVLIDEIDKAESDVPNSLLEALANGSFHVPYQDTPVKIAEDKNPLIIITTNEERTLPPAFLRRCLVLHMEFPKDNAVEWLMARARKHVKNVDDNMLKDAAKVILEARETVSGPHRPGLSEYIDLVRVLAAPPAYEKQPISWTDALKIIRPFVTDKNYRQSR